MFVCSCNPSLHSKYYLSSAITHQHKLARQCCTTHRSSLNAPHRSSIPWATGPVEWRRWRERCSCYGRIWQRLKLHGRTCLHSLQSMPSMSMHSTHSWCSLPIFNDYRTCNLSRQHFSDFKKLNVGAELSLENYARFWTSRFRVRCRRSESRALEYVNGLMERLMVEREDKMTRLHTVIVRRLEWGHVANAREIDCSIFDQLKCSMIVVKVFTVFISSMESYD